MPKVTCPRCSTDFELVFRPTSDHPPVSRNCPICGLIHVNQTVEPTMQGKPGPLEAMARSLSEFSNPKPGLIMRGTTIPKANWPPQTGPIMIRFYKKGPSVLNSETGAYIQEGRQDEFTY